MSIIVDFTYISCGTGATVLFPTGSIPANFTILSLTRYTASARGKILQGQNKKWLHGHWGGNRGVIYYEGWKTGNNLTDAEMVNLNTMPVINTYKNYASD